MVNSHGKVISRRSAFASRRHARALAACLPRQEHRDFFSFFLVWRTHSYAFSTFREVESIVLRS